MTLAYETGTATDDIDLIAKYVTFMTTNATLVGASEEWTIEHNSGNETLLKGTGLAGTDEIYIGIDSWSNPVNNQWGARIFQTTGYNPGEPSMAGQPNYKSFFLPLWDQPMEYWFTASGRRGTIMVKVDNRYFGSMQGFFLPYLKPSIYTYPGFVGSTTNILKSHTAISTSMNQPWKGYEAAGQVVNSFLDNNFNWRSIDGVTVGGDYWWPQAREIGLFGKAIDDTTYVIQPFTIITTTEKAQWGELEGVYYVGGEDLSAESTITQGPNQYICFPNVYRTGLEDWTALKIAE